jgi:hypothetical protein
MAYQKSILTGPDEFLGKQKRSDRYQYTDSPFVRKFIRNAAGAPGVDPGTLRDAKNAVTDRGIDAVEDNAPDIPIRDLKSDSGGKSTDNKSGGNGNDNGSSSGNGSDNQNGDNGNDNNNGNDPTFDQDEPIVIDPPDSKKDRDKDRPDQSNKTNKQDQTSQQDPSEILKFAIPAVMLVLAFVSYKYLN